MENGFEGGFLSCTVMIENLALTGGTLKKVTHRNATLQLGRNEFRDVMLRLETGKKSQRYSVKEVGIHKKFAKDGKATIRLDHLRLQFMLSNCPPDKLILFLKTLSTKVQCRHLENHISNRKRLLSELPRTFEDISPLNIKELQTVHSMRAKAEERANPDIFTPKGKTGVGGIKRKRPDLGSGKENIPQKSAKFAKMENGTVMLKPSMPNMVVNQPVNLSKEQMRVLDIVKQGFSVFFTGSAGTGKSFLLRRIIGALPPQSTFATASTGVAACHIGGTTLHAFAGIGSGKADIEQCVELASRPAIAKQWRSCKHLIIDEVSMVDGDYFDKLETVARVIRKTDSPFGGIQVILCGDFLQLPPVTKGKEKRKFAFQSKAWRKCVDKNLELTTVRRQSDQKFIRILQDIRVGRCSEEVCETLTATARHSLDKDGIMATRLCTHKEDVDHINQIQINKLTGTSKTYEASDSDPGLRSTVDALCPIKYKLELKEGAQVMLAKNLDVSQGLVNGARGVVTGFESGVMGYPVVKFRCGVTVTIRPVRWTFKAGGGIYLTRRQLPLKLAWAISIHKSQGMSLDCVEISLSRVFESGQSYVALSRARSLEGLRVIDFDKRCVRANPDVLRFYRTLQMSSCLQQTHMENYYSTQAAPF